MTGQIRQLIIEPEAKQALKRRYNETNDRRWQERIQCVLLKGQGLTLEAISDVLLYNPNTISYWIREYAEKGLEGLCIWEYQGSTSHLSAEQQQELKEEVTQTRYNRVADVVAWVENRWQIHYRDDGMREMLHNLDFSLLLKNIRVGLFGIEPIATQMRFQIRLILRNAQPDGARCCPQCRASPPRLPLLWVSSD